MGRRRNWSANPKVQIERVTDSEFTESLAEIAEIVYTLIRSRQLRQKFDPSIATKPIEIASQIERKVANDL